MSRRVVDQHADWLGLLDPDGAFLTAPVLAAAFPTGLERTPAALREEVKERFASSPRDAPEARRRIEWLLRKVLGFGERLVVDTSVPDGLTAEGQRGVELRADGALIEPQADGPAAVRLALMFVPRGTSLDSPTEDPRWSASPIERMTHLLRAAGVPLGLLSDGRWLALVWAPRGIASGHGVWDTDLLLEERVLLDGLFTVLNARRFFASGPERTPEHLFRESTSRQAEVTKELGRQVRQAVELLLSTLARADRHQGGQLLPDDGHLAYEAAVTVMMRLVFCLYAEERRLLPAGAPTYDSAYAVGTLLEALDDEARAFGPEVLEHRTAGWHRLLATFRAIHGGVAHEDLNIPAYGGGLFDPDRYPFLEGRQEGTAWHEAPARPLPVDDRTVLEVLRALQELRMGRETRRLSFRTLDVEQIGHVYEGLLDHSATRADAVYLGLTGKFEPEIPLEDLETEHTSDDALIVALREEMGATEAQIRAALTAELDADGERLLLLACGDDTMLADRVRPYVGLVRRDLRGLPVVIHEGAVMVTQTTVRRDTGTQYTTRELADEIAVNALEPLVFEGPAEGQPREQWRLRRSSELVGLKVCDPAVGSGAIIVAALRYLSERLLEAWETEEVHQDLLPEDRLTLARREIAEHCLYGVDRDPMALEMAKLSLWLSTMSRERPFTFLDHSFKAGDSLLGVTGLDQLRHLHLDPDRGRKVMGLRAFARAAPDVVDPKIDRALELIKRLERLTTTDVRAAEEKRRLEEAIQEELVELQILGDMIVGAAMVASFRKPREYDAALVAATHAVTSAAPGQESAAINGADEATHELVQTGLPDGATSRVPLHWPLAFPEVFVGDDRNGFDAMIGNPPFRGGQYLTDTLGTSFRDYLVGHVAEGTSGSADLVAYFFLRTKQTVRREGQVGFIATNSIAQGQTKKVGLSALVANGATVRRAMPERPWPGAAGVHVAQVWLTHGPWNGERWLEGVRVTSITSGLTDGGRPDSSVAERLRENAGLMFQGPIPIGEGFYNVSEMQVEQWLADEQSDNASVVKPFLTGSDICDRPDAGPRRWCVDFGYMSKEEAATFVGPFSHVEATVKEFRQSVNRQAYRDRWWQFGEPRRGMRQALEGLERYIAVPATASRYLTSWQRVTTLPNNAVIALASEDDYVMGVMTSRIHEIWARSRPSSLETRFRYTPREMFETFPFPAEPTSDARAAVARASQRLHGERSRISREASVGLTELYNRVDRGEFRELRESHEALDRAVAQAYAWPIETLDDDDAVLAKLVELSAAISAGTQRYAPGIRPERREPTEEHAGGTMRMRL